MSEADLRLGKVRTGLRHRSRRSRIRDAARSSLWLVVVFALQSLARPTTTYAEGPAELLRRTSKEASATVDHSALTSLLTAFISPNSDGINRVRYASFKRQGHARLKQYIRAIEGTDLARLNRGEQFALLANLYNAKTLDIVLDRYPVKSIKDINLGGGLLGAFGGGPWKAKVVNISGVLLSLDDLEHGMLRPVFRDPRVHYAVNCASIGCPNLQPKAFTGAGLQSQLNAAAGEFINHARGVEVNNGRVVASSIYQWFNVDFGGNAEGVLSHLRRYGRQQLLQELSRTQKIDNYQYDWTLNDEGS